MAIIVFIETVSLNGSRQTERLEFNQRRVVMGRGAGVDLRFESKSLALKQASFIDESTGFAVENLDSLKSMMVNGEKTERANLNEDDEIQWGDLVVTVERLQGSLQLRVVVEEGEKLDRHSRLSKELARFDMGRWMSQMTTLSVISLALVLFFFLVLPLTQSKEVWNPGPLASPHKVLEGQCSSCHSGNAWVSEDQKCLSCHALSTHGSKGDRVAPRCAHCHSEHRNGVDFTRSDSRICSDCHGGDMNLIKSVHSWSAHPDFSWNQRSSDEASYRFSHQKHLQEDLERREGFEALKCIDCHRPESDRMHFKKVSFKDHCSSCHSLEFRAGSRTGILPHDTTDEAFRYLERVWNGQAGGVLTETRFGRRRRPGEATAATKTQTFLTLRELERDLFTKSLCGSCHEMQERTDSHQEPTNRNQERSHFEVMKTVSEAPRRHASSFSRLHRSHQSLTCQACHRDVALADTRQIDLKPGVRDCATCHQDGKGSRGISSPCSFCHGYHQSLVLDPSREGSMTPKGSSE